MIKEHVYYETSDGEVFVKYNDAQKHENKITDPLSNLVNKEFSGHNPVIRRCIYNVINANRDEFIRVLMHDQIGTPDENSHHIDKVLDRLHEERNLPKTKFKVKVHCDENIRRSQ